MDDKLLDALADDFLKELPIGYRGGITDIEGWLRGLADGSGLGNVIKYIHEPVGIREFIESEELLNAPVTVWPRVMESLEELNSGKYSECVLTGAIGTAKTTIALYTQAYQVYLLSCLREPHAEFDLDPSSEIVIIFQSLNKELAKDVDYGRFREMVKKSPYFTRHFPFDTSRESDMRFPNRLVVKPVAGHDKSAIGQNVIGGIIDEINFMAVVEGSKVNRDGGVYDQAVQNYNSISVRRKSRFMKLGELPGMLCLVSSRNYPGQFTDVKESEARKELQETGQTSIYVYDKKVWDLRPQRYGFHGGVRTDHMVRRYGEDYPFWFNVFIGDITRQPRVLDANEGVPDSDKELVIRVPVEHKVDFENDIQKALRDIAGVATLSLCPYMLNTKAVSEAFGKTLSILSRVDCDFVSTKVQIYPKRFKNLGEKRFVHLDLALSKDYAGVSCGYVSGFKKVDRGDYIEELPVVDFDFTLEVRPPRGGEIVFDNIRALLYKLRDLGLPITWVSSDTFQSVDSMQILHQNGFTVGTQSMDTSTVAYDVTKAAFYDGRIRTITHDRAQREMVSLEYHAKQRYIDHPPNGGSKDVADSMAGVVYGLTMRREIWHRHRVPLNKIPRSLLNSESKGKKSMGYAERVVGEFGGNDA